MKATIDKAGRVVIPAPIRERARITPGSELEITADDAGVHLRPDVQGPKLVRVGKRLVAVPTERRRQRLSRVDVSRLVEAERERWPL